MKYFLFLLILLSFIPSKTFARITNSEGKFYIQAYGEKNSIFMLNKLAEEKLISQIKLFQGGQVHLVSYAKKGEKEKLYSVDSKGYIYAIAPFSTYSVSSIDNDGHIHFKEVPGRRYFISSKGFFLH